MNKFVSDLRYLSALFNGGAFLVRRSSENLGLILVAQTQTKTGHTHSTAGRGTPRGKVSRMPRATIIIAEQLAATRYRSQQESPADAVKPARRKSMPKLLQFDVFRFISLNSISTNCQCIASRGRPIFSQALGLYSCTQFEIRCLPIIKFLVQIAST